MLLVGPPSPPPDHKTASTGETTKPVRLLGGTIRSLLRFRNKTPEIISPRSKPRTSARTIARTGAKQHQISITPPPIYRFRTALFHNANGTRDGFINFSNELDSGQNNNVPIYKGVWNFLVPYLAQIIRFVSPTQVD